MKSVTLQYAVRDDKGRYYTENALDDLDGIDQAMLWKTRRGAANTAEDWGCALIPAQKNTVVEIEVVVTETRKPINS